MLAKLAGHSMFAAPGALDRLRMCADCRVKAMVVDEPGGIDLTQGREDLNATGNGAFGASRRESPARRK